MTSAAKENRLKGVPFLGLLPRLRKDPLGLLLEASHHGDLVPLDLGVRRAYLVNHPDLIKRILQDNRGNYPKSVLYEKMRPAFGDGLLTAEGEKWATQRRLIQPAFSHSRLDGMARLMVAETLARLPALEAAAAKGQALDMSAELSALTLSIVVKAMFGAELTDDLGGIADAVEVLNEHSNRRFHTLWDVPAWIPTPRNRKAGAALDHIESIVYRIIRGRRVEGKGRGAAGSSPEGVPAASPTSSSASPTSPSASPTSPSASPTSPSASPTSPSAPAPDLLGMLLAARYDDGSAMDEVQVRDEVMTIFFAGHETTATALAWTLQLLDQNPGAEAALRKEIEALGGQPPSFADLHRLPYARMVLEESMRVRPPVWSFSRTARGPDELGGVAIPKGALMFISPYSMHRDARWWDAAESFRPERFTAEASEKRPRYAYFPFGGGPRMCIGNGFAMTEGALVLACLLRKFRFRADPARPAEMLPLVTLRPKGGMWMTPVPAPIPARA